MQELVCEFQKLLKKKNIDTTNEYLKEILLKFVFFYYSDILQTEKRSEQYESNSKIIIIDEFIQNSVEYYVLCFDYKLIILPSGGQKVSSILPNIFVNINDCVQYFIQSNDNESEIFSSEIQNFSKEFTIKIAGTSTESKIRNKKIQQFWSIVVNSISGFLIKKGYQNSRNSHDKYLNDKFVEYKDEKSNYANKSYVELRNLGKGTGGTVKLIYYISKEEIFALKFPNEESLHLIKRERKNYLNIRYPFIVQYIGYIKLSGRPKYLLLEYVEGETLDKYQLNNLNDHEKYSIILELLLTIGYLHSQNYIYRDFRFSNIIINQNKDAILIDFDRLRKVNDETKDEEQTKDFLGEIIAPENYKTYESDVYCLGCIIHFILYGKIPKINDTKEIKEDFIFKNCLEKDPAKRPNIRIMMNIFYFILIFSHLINSKVKKICI